MGQRVRGGGPAGLSARAVSGPVAHQEIAAQVKDEETEIESEDLNCNRKESEALDIVLRSRCEHGDAGDVHRSMTWARRRVRHHGFEHGARARSAGPRHGLDVG